MRQTIYILENKSNMEGTFYFDDKEKHTIFPKESVTSVRKPISYSENITLKMFKRELETEILNKKKRT